MQAYLSSARHVSPENAFIGLPVELLHTITSELHPDDWLNLRRTCRSFRATITFTQEQRFALRFRDPRGIPCTHAELEALLRVARKRTSAIARDDACNMIERESVRQEFESTTLCPSAQELLHLAAEQFAVEQSIGTHRPMQAWPSYIIDLRNTDTDSDDEDYIYDRDDCFKELLKLQRERHQAEQALDLLDKFVSQLTLKKLKQLASDCNIEPPPKARRELYMIRGKSMRQMWTDTIVDALSKDLWKCDEEIREYRKEHFWQKEMLHGASSMLRHARCYVDATAAAMTVTVRQKTATIAFQRQTKPMWKVCVAFFAASMTLNALHVTTSR